MLRPYMTFKRKSEELRTLPELQLPRPRLLPAVLVRDYTASAAPFFNDIGEEAGKLVTRPEGGLLLPGRPICEKRHCLMQNWCML
jgi:hypothetical protein